MAVTLTATELAAALAPASSPLDGDDLTNFATRFLAYATERIEKAAPNAPETTQNEACIRMAAYELDRRSSSIGLIDDAKAIPASTLGAFSNAWRFSGAQEAVLPWVNHGAGIVGADDEEDES